MRLYKLQNQTLNFELKRRRASKLKKFLAIILGALLVLSFAASAFAIHAEIPAETQAVVAKSTTQIELGGFLRTRGWYFKNRAAGNNPFSTNSQSYYDQRAKILVDAKVTPNVEGLIELQADWNWGTFNTKADNPDIIQAWILYKGTGLFGFNSGLKIGHMPLALGEQQFFQHTTNGDDAIVFFMDPTKALHIGLLTIKLANDGGANVFTTTGSATNNTDDLDAYVALMTYKINDKNTIGANYTYLNKSDMRLKLQNLGLHANGNIAGLGYKGELDVQFGDITNDVKARGWGLMLGLNYKVNPVNIRASFAYGSGDKDSTDKQEAFQTFLSDVEHYTIAYDYRIATTAGSTLTGISNTTYYNLGLDYSPTKDINLKLDGYLLRASRTPSGVSKSAGWELDAGLKYAVAKNLNYIVDLGYFKAGNFYEDTYGSREKGSTVVRQQLILSF